MSNTSVRIELGATFDPKGFSDAKKAVTDLDRYTENVRRNQLFRSGRGEAAAGLNLFRQGSDVFTQGLSGTSPFMIAIQQGPQVIDILLSGAMSAGKFATALAGIGVGVAGVMGAVHAYKRMDEAIQDAAASQDQLNQMMAKAPKLMGESGIAPGMGEKAISFLERNIARVQKQIFEMRSPIFTMANSVFEAQQRNFERNPSQFQRPDFDSIFAIMEKRFAEENPDIAKTITGFQNAIKAAEDRIKSIRSGIDEQRGGARLFAEQIDPAAMKAMQDRAMQEAAKTLTLSDVARTRQSLEAVSREYDAMPPSPEKAQALNSMNKTTEALNALEKAIMERVSSEQERAQEVLDTFFDGTFRSQQEEKSRTAAMTAEAASARQRIGGMANAPILSSFQKQVDLLKNIADTSRQTAANTARSTPPASPVSFPDTDFGEWQSSRLRTFN